MAVYKSTQCYPFLNNIDIRTALMNASSDKPVQILTCKVDTSNKNITGYSIRVLDENNNVVFPPKERTNLKISPISELQSWEYKENGVNSGINGTYLKIPFFQNKEKYITKSWNVIYYRAQYSVDHIIYLADETASPENPNNWILVDGEDSLYKYNWDANPEATLLDKIQNKIALDGEIILEGQTILVTHDGTPEGSITAGFYKVVKTIDTTIVSGQKISVTCLEKITNNDWEYETSDEIYVNVIKGKTHHNKYLYKEAEENDFIFASSDINWWSDIEGHDLSDLFIGTSMYKWEITLYQGECETVDESDILSCDYETNFSNSNYDMVLTQGTILGSNSSRVQIAFDEPFKPDKSINKDCVLPSQKDGVLVLQNKYMDFGVFPSNLFSKYRCRVQSYDSTLGHVYPVPDSLTEDVVSQNNYVQFYKYSNNPDEILDSDKLTYGLDKEVTFYYYHAQPNEDHVTVITSKTKEQFDNDNINNRLYGMPKSTFENINAFIANNISEGETLLLTNASLPYQNGVYQIYYRPDAIDEHGQPDENIYFKRVAPYNTWGSYLGRVFYVANYVFNNDTMSSYNLESLAESNTDAALWNPDVVAPSSGESNLFFTQEMPIMLFEDQLEEKNYFDVCTTLELDSSHWDTSPYSVLDGIPVFENMKVYGAYSYNSDPETMYGYRVFIAKIVGGQKVFEQDTTQLRDGDYIFIKQGQKYGKKVIEVNADKQDTPYEPEISWRFHSATILKNKNTIYGHGYTYISPFINISKNMKLKLTGNNKVVLDGETEETQWLTIKNLNNTVYCVLHEKLASPEVLSSKVATDIGTPWKYEIRSFFKASDANPFYCYESPYLVLYKNNSEYSGLLNMANQQEFFVVNGNTHEPFYVDNPGRQFIVGTYQDAGSTYAKPLKLSANYIQGDGLSWESYRWLLLNSEGKILQDTGKKYDKELSVVFYGLSNDSIDDSYSTYYVVLYVEDELNNILNYSIQLTVQKGGSIPSYFPFKAEYECNLHAMKLTYAGESKMAPSYRNEQSDYFYVPSAASWDEGMRYTDNYGFEIKNKNGEDFALIDYSQGSTISGNDGIPYKNNLSKASLGGVSYYRSMENNSDVQNINEDLNLAFPETELLDNNSFYFDTEFGLTRNYCGKIVEWFLQGDTNSSDVGDLYMNDEGEMPSLKGYLQFKLKTAENFDDNPIPSNLNEDRNQLILELTAYPTHGEDITLEESIEDLLTFDINYTVPYYYIQSEKQYNNLSKTEKEEREWLNFNISYKPYIRRDKNGEYFSGSSEYFLGNLCLSGDSQTPNICYWVEDRPFITTQISTENQYFLLNSNDETFLQHIDGINGSSYVDTNTDLLKWPDIDYETARYWNDTDGDAILSNDLPLKWEDVTCECPEVEKVIAIDRHATMEKDYYLCCKIFNIDALYSAILDNGNLEFDQTESEPLNKIYKIILKSNGRSLGEVKIICYEEDGV